MNFEEIKELTDAAKRLSDIVSLHLIAQIEVTDAVNKWCAFRLDDGRSDGVIYDTKQDAIRHQKGDPKKYCYLRITPDGIPLKDAIRFLKTNRLDWIDTTAPEPWINPIIYPKHSNLKHNG